jgi:hypothetical protein
MNIHKFMFTHVGLSAIFDGRCYGRLERLVYLVNYNQTVELQND